jgi:hypothetical protein
MAHDDIFKPILPGSPEYLESLRPAPNAINPTRKLTPEEVSLMHHFGHGGIPLDAAAELAVIILDLRARIEVLEGRS